MGITIFVMLIINIIIAIMQDRFAKDIFNIYYDFTSIIFWLIALPIMILYSILPDIDHQKSITTLLAYSIGALFMIVGVIYKNLEGVSIVNNNGLIIYGIVIIFSTLFFSAYTKHRGPTHTIQFMVFSIILLGIIGIEKIIYYTIAFISIWTHLWLDKIPFKVSFKPINKQW